MLDKLAQDGKISATEFQAAWSKALDGKDLAEFEVKARAAFAAARSEAEKAATAVQEAIARGVSGEPLKALKAQAEATAAVVTREAERSAQLMDGLLREAVKRTGLEYEQLQGKIGAASRSAINDVEAIIAGLGKLKAEGVDTGRALTASLSKAIQTADTEKALDVVRSQIEQVRKVLGDKIANGLLDQAKEKANALKDALDAATPGINSVREAMKELGITSDESLKKTAATAKEAYDTMVESGKNSARELSEAFKKSAEAAIAANKGIAPAWVEGAAALRGYRIEVDAAGKSTLVSADAVDRAGRSHDQTARSIDTHRTALEKLNAEKEREIAALEKSNDLKTRELKLEEAKRNAGVIQSVDSVPAFESKEQADAWLAEWEKQYAKNNPFTTKTDGFQRQTTRAEWQAEVDALALRNTMKGKGNASESSQTPLESMRSGATYVSNITLDGKTTSVRFADAQSQRDGEDLLRRLAQSRGSAIR